MNRSLRLALTAAGCLALPFGPAAASGACHEPACDEQQIGPYVAPDIEAPDLENRFDPRGKAIAVPGLNGVVVRHRPGAGVWLGEAPGRANVFVKPGRDRLTLDMKLDF